MIKHLKNTTKWFIEKCIKKFLVNVVSDEVYLKCIFRLRVGYCLNLNNPQTFNEKIQWLKLNNMHPEYTSLVDKIEVKHFVESKIGKQYIIPTIATWNSVADIDWDKLPNSFVIKCTGDSGGVVVCKNKDDLDISNAKRILMNGWGQNYYRYSKEYPYKNVVPRIIAEEYMEDEFGELRDYKFFCFNGVPKYFKIDYDRRTNHHANYYDIEGNRQYIYEGSCPPDFSKHIELPGNLKQMADVARKIASEIKASFVRVDLYNIKGAIYFGEITFFPMSGLDTLNPVEWDYKFGEYIRI